ncbi:MAG TPA: hypothetical protein VI299_22510, partial [Polyangiales bacterium]
MKSLVGRVALASALAAALGGSAAAVSAGLTAKQMVAQREQATLDATARELAAEVLDELEEEPDEDDDAEERAEHAALRALAHDPEGRLAWALAHELDELDLPGKRAAVFRGGAYIAGDPRLPRPREDCALDGVQRVCAVPLGARTLVLAARAEAELDRRALFSDALWLGVLCGALLGGVASYALSRWALRPLTALRDGVRAIPVDASDASMLAMAAQPEVEELRV